MHRQPMAPPDKAKRLILVLLMLGTLILIAVTVANRADADSKILHPAAQFAAQADTLTAWAYTYYNINACTQICFPWIPVNADSVRIGNALIREPDSTYLVADTVIWPTP